MASRRYSAANSSNFIRSYDHSPAHSPTQSPSLSRKNSTASNHSTRSEPHWDRSRQNSSASNASETSAQTDTPKSRKSSFSSLFHKEKKPKGEKAANDKIVITSKHAGAVKAKMMTNPSYKQALDKSHQSDRPGEIGGLRHTAHSQAYDQEMRHPHSGPPALHAKAGDTALALTKVDSVDEEPESDNDLDDLERLRKQWNQAPEHNNPHVPEIMARSRPGSRQVTPAASRETSPVREALGSRQSSYSGSLYASSLRPMYKSRNSWGGAYVRDEAGKWTKKEKVSPPLTPGMDRREGGLNTLAEDLRERLRGVS